jgi:hypothetical protein
MDFWSEIDRKNFFNFLQFLVYEQSLDYEIDSLGPTYYRQVIFRVQDFLKYQKESNNYYQLKKLVEFFDELQGNSLIKSFSDTHYRSLVTIPEVDLQKSNQNCWTAKVLIVEELFYYAHTFLLPGFFQQKASKHEFEVQFKVIEVFSTVDIEKTFYIKDFFENYQSKLTNQNKTKIKNYFIQFIKMLEDHELLINSKYKIISEGFIVYEKLSV